MFDQVDKTYSHLSERRKIYESIRKIINELVTDLISYSQNIIDDKNPQSIHDVRAENKPIIQFSDSMFKKNRELKKFLNQNLYQHYKVHRMSQKAKNIVIDLYNSFYNDIKLMPDEYQQYASVAITKTGADGKARIVADYIAGMTDRYAIAEHERLFSANTI